MKRLLPSLLVLLGILLSVSGVLVMAQEATEVPDVPETLEPPEYAGTRECRDCHGRLSRVHRDTAHAQTMVELEEDMEPEENPVVADFSVGEDVRTVSFPEESAPRAFTMEDIAFTLGAGRNVQAYIYQAEESTYYVLPAQWNVDEQLWEPLDLGGEWLSEAYDYGLNCAGCHTVGLDVEDYSWEEEAVMCESCHGPGLTHVEAADDAGGSIDEEEYQEIFSSIHIPYGGQACGQCHVRGLASDGVHPYPTGYYPGLVALSDTFEPVPTDDDEHWWPTGHAQLPNMQHNEWLLSGHPSGLESAQESENFEAACLSCHSATQQLVDLRLSYDDLDPETIDPLALAEMHPSGVSCASCHDSHPEELGEDEPVPVGMPRMGDYAQCVDCHSDSDVTEGIHYPVREVFEGVAMLEEVEVEPGIHFTEEDGPTCTTCHMPTIPTYNGERSSHTMQMIAPGEAMDIDALQDGCSGCHDEGPQQLQNLIDDIQTDTQERIAAARALTDDDTPSWVLTALDIVESEGSYGIHNYAYTDTLLDAVETALGMFAE